MRVYVSSTLTDLHAYRAAVMAAIRTLGHEPVAMEDYPAEDQVPAEKVRADVARCDVYLGIVAWRYGFVPAGYDCSITELEYRTATEHSIPTLVFLLDETVAWPPLLFDDDRHRVRVLREELKAKSVIKHFVSPDDLQAKATAAMVPIFRRLETGVARAGANPLVPAKPLIFLSRLPMTGAARFGRTSELRQMDRAWDEERVNVLSIVAWGGVGKSALVNTWLARMANDNYRGASRAFAWSFYNQGAESPEASADVFIAEALKWFGDPDPSRGSVWEKGERLAELVRRMRTLLILDGLEVLQHSSGPDERHLERHLTDQGMQALLRDLAWQNPGLCVIATRSPVLDLQPFLSNTVEEIVLEHLTPEAGAELLASLGVKGTRAEMIEAAQEFGGHALALTLLGSYLAEWHDGQVWHRHEIEKKEGAQWRRMIDSYERMLDRQELDLLRIVGLFSGPAQGDALSAIRQPPAIAGLTEDLSNATWPRAVAKLRKLHLLAEKSPDRPDSLDAHPLVRQHFGHQLEAQNPQAWREANARLYEHHRRMPASELPDTLEEMVPLFQAVTHGCRAGRHQEVWDEVYWTRIRRTDEGFSSIVLGAYGADQAALANFFEEGWERLVSALDDLAQARALTEAAFNMRGLGRLDEAISLGRVGTQMHLRHGRLGAAGDAAGNLSEVLVTFGDLKEAIAVAEQSIALAGEARNDALLVTNRATLADALHQCGELDAARAHFEEAEGLHAGTGQTGKYLHALRGYHFCDLLLALGLYDDVLERAQASLEVDKANNLPHGIGLGYLALARAHMARASETGGDLERASELMAQAVAELRRAGHQELIVRGLLARAHLQRMLQVYDESQATLEEVWDTAVRGQMGLHQADTCLQFAQLHLACGRRELASHSLSEARPKIRKMGYRRRDGELRDLTSQLES